MVCEEVAAKGYTLLCVAMPLTDVKIATVPEVGGWVGGPPY